MTKHILLYGNDPLLLQIRALLLKHSGFEVDSISNRDALAERLTSSQVDLLIFCHTLSLFEQQAAYALVRALSPELKMITLVAGYSVAADSVADILNISEGPQVLVNRSRQLTA